MPTYGTHGVADLLATQFNTSVIAPDFDAIFRELNRVLMIHNDYVEEIIGTIVNTTTTERLVTYGGSAELDFTEMDEYGTPEAQKLSAGATLGLPLRLYERAIQWNYTWFEEHSPRELGAVMDGLLLGDIKNISLALRTAFFRPTNYTFADHLVDNVSLAVKALINADSTTIPMSPDGVTTFDGSTHTHYLGVATFTAAGLNSVVDTVREHFNTGQTVLLIPAASEASIRGLTGASEFIPAGIEDVQYGSSTTVLRTSLDTTQSYNRFIGRWGPNAVPVWVKPWVPANYALAYQEGVPAPVVRRIRTPESAALRMRFKGEIHPLGYEVFERKFGFGVQNRMAAAVLRTNNATYAIPSLT
jgi:hypothetical protein